MTRTITRPCAHWPAVVAALLAFLCPVAVAAPAVAIDSTVMPLRIMAAAGLSLRVSQPRYLSPDDGASLDAFDAEYMTLDDGSVWLIFQEESPDNAVFNDGKVWLSSIDAATGQCPTDTGCRARELAGDAMQIAGCAWKGPNFGLYTDQQNRQNWRVFYHLSADNGGSCGGRRYIVSRDPLTPGSPDTTPLGPVREQTSSSVNRANGLASQDWNMPLPYMAFVDNLNGNPIRYQRSGPPFVSEQDPQGRAGFRWVSGKPWLITSIDGQAQGPALDGEIQAHNVLNGDIMVVSDASNNPDGFNHSDAYGWQPPEYPGTVSVASRLEGAAGVNTLRIYRQTGQTGQTWAYDRTLEVPNDRCDERVCAFDGEREGQSVLLQSWEPFVYDGRSYFIGTVKRQTGANPRDWDESEVWLLSYTGEAARLHPRYPGRVFHEAEAYVTDQDTNGRLFISFNEIERVADNPDLRPGRLWRVRVRNTP